MSVMKMTGYHVAVLALVLLYSSNADSKCGYSSCPSVKDGMINVHLVPHTHDDVGWLKTVDQYFYGDRQTIQQAGVQYILDSVIPELLADPTKRFIYVEIAFFKRWWQEQTDNMQRDVKFLVQNDRLEFILGGWCMNDEAGTHYNAIIDQHSLGFEFLKMNFQECGRPRIGWQIDPFGHSREQASLFAQFGFDGLFFGRLDYQDKDTRLKDKTMEMVWKGSPDNLGEAANLFTGVLFNGYGPPGGFCWDSRCSDEPIMDDPRLHDFNVNQKVYDFLKAVEDQAGHYVTNNIIMTMGSDFQYSNAHTWYKNMDKLIKYTNAQQQSNNSKVNLLYSTPSCYLYQLNQAKKTWPTKEDDFFPYAHRAHTFWTGYFTSRAALKDYVRRSNNFLQMCQQMDALAKLTDTTPYIQRLREAMGVAQHHDAVSGTEKQQVAYDYAERLALGTTECEKVVNEAYTKFMEKGSDVPPVQSFCTLLNISLCNITEESKQLQVTVYNPVGRAVSAWVRIPVIGAAYDVQDPNGKPVPTQVIPITDETKRIPERNGSLAQNELLFSVQLPPLGFSTYFIQASSRALYFKHKQTEYSQKSKIFKGYRPNADVVIKNQFLSLTFDGSSGHLKEMRNLESDLTIPLTQDFMYYTGFSGNNSKDIFQASGAYIFRPNGSEAHSFPQSLKLVQQTKVVQGQLVSEVHQIISPWVSQVVRLYDNERHAEFEWTVGPIPIGDKIGREVVSRFNTGLATAGMYYTDANGREVLQRQRNFRKTWKLNQTEPVAGNYYPVNSRIFLRDGQTQFTVLTDRSQGGASIQDGSLELMVHRRLLYDDSLGVGEPLNETGSDGKGLVVRGKHYVILDTVAKSAALHRELALRLYLAPVASFTNASMKQSDWAQKFNTMWSGLKSPIPPNVHMLTLQQWTDLSSNVSATRPYLIRLEHIYEKNEDPVLSKPVTVSLENMFTPFSVASIKELTLGANLPKADLHRLVWQTADKSVTNADKPIKGYTNTVPAVTLNPMEIRTFLVTLSK